MKLKNVIVVMLCLVSIGAQAQRKYFARDQRKVSFINNIDFSGGLYMPKMSGFNENWSILSGDDALLDGAVRANVEIYAHLYRDGYLGVVGGYYTDGASISGTTYFGTDMEESITFSAIPIGGRFIHEFHVGDMFSAQYRHGGAVVGSSVHWYWDNFLAHVTGLYQV